MREINFPATRFAMSHEELEKCIKEGIEFRFPEGFDAKYQSVLKSELELLDSAPEGWTKMLLFTHHFLKDMKTKYPNSTSSGRGAISGSLIAYLLRINEIDPVLFGLGFEKFYTSLNVSPIPAIDIDVATSVIDQYCKYLQENFGEDCVFGCTVNLKDGRKGVHACAVFVSDVPYTNIGTLYDSTSKLNIINLTKSECEELNLMRFSLIASDSVDKLMKAKERDLGEFDILKMSVSQLQDVLSVENFENGHYLTAYNKIPKEFTSSFNDFVLFSSVLRISSVSKKIIKIADFKKNPVKYGVDAIDSILAESYGKIVYLEQETEILKFVLGVTFNQADSIRKDIAKKNTNVINSIFGTFVKTLVEAGCSYDKILLLWNEIVTPTHSTTSRAHAFASLYDVAQLAYLTMKGRL